MRDRLMQFFKYEHLPAHLQAISKPFAELAEHIEAARTCGQVLGPLQNAKRDNLLRLIRNCGLPCDCENPARWVTVPVGEPTPPVTPQFSLGQAFVTRVTSPDAPEPPSVIGVAVPDDELTSFALDLAIATLDEEGCNCHPEEPCALCMCRLARQHLREVTPPATPQPETCEWPGCDAPALCQSGNFGNRLVCREHFGITNGPLSPPPDVERLTREAFKAGFLAVCRKKSDDTPLDMLTRVWTFDGVAAADLEPEAYAAWRALSPSTPGEPT